MCIEFSVCLVVFFLILIVVCRRGMKGKDGIIGWVFFKNFFLFYYKEIIFKSGFYVYYI